MIYMYTPTTQPTSSNTKTIQRKRGLLDRLFGPWAFGKEAQGLRLEGRRRVSIGKLVAFFHLPGGEKTNIGMFLGNFYVFFLMKNFMQFLFCLGK